MAEGYFQRLKERLNRPGGPPIYYRITNLVVAIMIIVAGIVFITWLSFLRIMLGVYEIVFGIWMVMFEVADICWLTKHVQFMFTWLGRGLFYIFVGCLTMGHKTFGWVFGSIITLIGVIYVVLSFSVMKNENYIQETNEAVSNTTMYRDSTMASYGGADKRPSFNNGQGQHPYGYQPQYPYTLPQISQTEFRSNDHFDYLHKQSNPEMSSQTHGGGQ